MYMGADRYMQIDVRLLPIIPISAENYEYSVSSKRLRYVPYVHI